MVATQSDLDLTRYCFRCHSHWAGRLRSGAQANWATQVPGRDFRSDESPVKASREYLMFYLYLICHRMYVIVVGYDDYVSLDLRIDSVNIIDATAHKLKRRRP